MVVIRRARLLWLVPAVLLVMIAGSTIGLVHDYLADAFNMHPRPVQEQIDEAERTLRK